MLNRLFFVLFLFVSIALSAQESDHPRTNQNYFDICRQMDEWFETEYVPETDCWDDEWVKYQRWKYTWRDRVMPDGSFPPLAEQYDTYRRLQTGSVSRNNSPEWKLEGPKKNTGGGYWGMGRTKHVAFHPTNPDIFYVGTPDGGIWKTFDSGTNWISLGDHLPYLPVGIIRIDAQHPDTLYISLGGKSGWWEWGLGIYKSTDGGATWAPSGLNYALSDNWVIYALEISPDNPQMLLAATNKGLWKTADGGANWTKKMDGEITDLKLKPDDATVAYAVLHNYWEHDNLFKSTNSGDTWTQSTNFTETQNDTKIIVTPAAPEWVGLRMSNGKKFWLSKEAGQNFEYRSELPEDAILSFSPSDSNIIYTSGVVVFRSVDQGATWEQITHWYNNGIHPEVHADVHDIVHYPHAPKTLFFCNDGGIYRHNEQTNSWTDLSNGLGIAQFYRIAVSETGFFRLAAGSQDNGGWLRKGSTIWSHTNGGDAMTQAIDPTNSNIMFTEYYGGNAIYRSTDSWFSNTTISDNLPDDPSGDWVTPFVMNPLRPASMLFGFHDIYRTYDRGDHYDIISQNLTGSVDNKIRDVRYAPSDTNIIVASWSNKMYRTTNGGQSWVTRTVTGNEGVTRLAVHPSNPAIIWATKGGYEANKKVFKSTNGGTVWANISTNMPNVPVNCIIYDSLTNYLIAGTDIGVFYTDANTINWQPYGQGLPNVWVLDLQIRQVTRTLYVGTHGRGVYSAPMDLITSAGPEPAAADFSISPNPAQNVLHINAVPASSHIAMYDMMGRNVLSQNMAQEGMATVAVGQLPQGIYAVHITNKAGQLLAVKRVMVER